MKTWLLVLMSLPIVLQAQTNSGKLMVGTQFYQNVLLPDNYEGFGVGLNWKVGLTKGVSIAAHYMYEVNDLVNAGNIKRFQRGVGINYMPLHQKAFTPWVEASLLFNTLTVKPVSYLFSDKSDEVIEQNYFGLNLGLGASYKVNNQLAVNAGLYFQPQNYRPNYTLDITDDKTSLVTNSTATGTTVKPLLYFNVGITYQILKLW